MSEPQIQIRKSSDNKWNCKVIVIGNAFCGKTSLIKRFVKQQIPTNYMPTVGSSICKQSVDVTQNGVTTKVNLMLWDIAGQVQFNQLHHVYYQGTKGIIMVFDLTNPFTFRDLQKWHAELVKEKIDTCPIILVGNKSDLVNELRVAASDVEQIMTQLKIVDFIPTSALTGENVDKLFNTMAIKLFEKLK